MFNKSALFLFALIILPICQVSAQKTKSIRKPSAKTSLTKPAVPVENEKEVFEKAVAQTDLSAKITALQEFSQKFPKSENKVRALEIIVSTRAQLADEKLRAGETENAVTIFKQAVTDVPTPISEKLYTDVILQLPANLFYGGQQAAAVEVVELIKEKVKDNPKQLLGLASFYLGTENAAEAKKLAEEAIALDANLSAAYQTLGLANRLNFQLEESAAAYSKALEIDPNSTVSKRSLAEMKRALGKSDEAVTLYRELIEKDANDGAAGNGLILSLFNAGKKEEAEELFDKSLASNPNNLPLLVGAAYWYAAHNEGDEAAVLAQKALAIEPRYTWAYIALARGLAAQNRPLEAEKPLLLARQYGNFPTLNYELAAVRMSAGLFQEAANELNKSFTVKGGTLETKLANRVSKEANNFIELLELERRASIFEPVAADTPEKAEKIKSLLTLNQIVTSPEATEEMINQAADAFTRGDDKMKTHRLLYAANRLLQEKKNLTKATELTQSAIPGLDDSLTVDNAAAAVLADELIESRTLAISRGEVIVVPEVPRQTLSTVMRGRIEDTAGWALYQQGKIPESIVRLKRAVSILPEKSSFWRSSLWRLGSAQEANGDTKEALDAYIKSYKDGQPDLIRRGVIEAAYRKVNGNLDGLDDKIGAAPANNTVAQATSSPSPETSPTNQTVSTPENTPTPEVSPTTTATTEITPAPTASPNSTVTPETTPTPEATPEATPQPTATSETTPSPIPEAIPPATPTPEPSTSPTPVVETTPEIKAETSPTPTVTPEIIPEVTPAPSPSPEKSSESSPTPPANPDSSTTAKSKILLLPRTTPTATLEEKPVTPEATPSTTPETPSETTVAKTENPPGETIVGKSEKSSPAETPKSPFDPIIISVPKTTSITPKTEEKQPDKQNTEQTSSESAPPKENSVVAGSRLRVVVEDNLAKKPAASEPPAKKPAGETSSCLVASMEDISVLSEGGNLGILVGYADEGDISKIEVESSSPDDIKVTRDPEVGKQSNRAFFVIKSVSAKKGLIPVIFTSPCGRKEIRVTVR